MVTCLCQLLWQVFETISYEIWFGYARLNVLIYRVRYMYASRGCITQGRISVQITIIVILRKVTGIMLA